MTIQQRTSLPAWCQHVISNPDRYAILDTEITGPRFGGEVCDLAIIDPAGKVLFSKLLRPKCPIDPETSAFHGITNEMVATAKTFAEEWPEIEAALSSRIIIAYNAEFDKERLWHTARQHGITPRHLWSWQCFMLKYAAFYDAPNERGYSSPGWQKLEKALPQQGIPFVQEHRALSDALAVAKLIQRLAELGNEAARWSSEMLGEV